MNGTAAPHRPAVARPASRGRVPPAGGRRRHPHHSADARTREHSATQRYLNVTDEELRKGLEVSWRNKADRFAWRREADRPRWFPDCPRFVPGTGNSGSGAGLEPATFGL